MKAQMEGYKGSRNGECPLVTLRWGGGSGTGYRVTDQCTRALLPRSVRPAGRGSETLEREQNEAPVQLTASAPGWHGLLGPPKRGSPANGASWCCVLSVVMPVACI